MSRKNLSNQLLLCLVSFRNSIRFDGKLISKPMCISNMKAYPLVTFLWLIAWSANLVIWHSHCHINLAISCRVLVATGSVLVQPSQQSNIGMDISEAPPTHIAIAREYDYFPQFNIVALILWHVAWLSQLPVIAIFSWETFSLKLPALFIQFLRLCILLGSYRCYTNVILHCSCIAPVKPGDIPRKITDAVAGYSTKRALREIKHHAAIVMMTIDVKLPDSTRKKQDRSIVPDFYGDMTKQHYFHFCLLNQYMQHRGSSSCSLVCPRPSATVCSLGRHELCVQYLRPPCALCLGQTSTIATVMLAFQPLQLKGRVSCTIFCPWILPLRSGVVLHHTRSDKIFQNRGSDIVLPFGLRPVALAALCCWILMGFLGIVISLLSASIVNLLRQLNDMLKGRILQL